MRHPVLACAISATLASVISLTAIAATKPEAAIEYRQGIYHAMGWNFAPMADMLRGKADYDQADFAKRAARIAFYSQQLLEGFPPGSDKGAPTDAKPAIWQNFDDFKAKLSDFQDAAATLAETAKSGDRDAIKKAFAATGQTCKACHKSYRKD